VIDEIVRLDAKLLKKTGVFAFVSAELLACIGAGVFIGTWLDAKLGTKPYLTGALSIVGLAYCVWRIKRLANTWLKNE
jgi:F0F1-type ATP synthase assembly protein I